MLRWKKLSLSIKYTAIAAAILIVLFACLGTIIYRIQKQKLVQQTDERMLSQVDDLVNMFALETQYKEIFVAEALRVAHHLFYSNGNIKESTTKFLNVEATNQVTKGKKLERINAWTIQGTQVQYTTQLVDTIQTLTGANTAIFQKTSEGYIQISTNILRENGQRAVGFFIPDASPIVQAIERQQTYKTRAYLADEWYIAQFEPIEIEGQVRGMLVTAIKETDLTYLKKRLKEKKYFQTGHVYVINTEGEYIIHPIYEGKKIEEEDFVNYATTYRKGKYHYKFPMQDYGVWRWRYFNYYEPYQFVIGITVPEKELLEIQLAKIRFTLWMGFGICLIICLLGLSYIMRAISFAISKIVQLIKLMAKGKAIPKIQTNREDEMGSMASALNELIETLEGYIKFAQGIGKGDFATQFKPISTEDALGTALLEMRTSLNVVAQEDKKRSWMTEGVAKFSEILQKNNDQLQQLSFELISNLVKYVAGNQGGMFIVNDDNANNLFLELVAAYAYDRKKILKKTVRPGEGLIGQSYREADTLNIKDIPENYVNVASGLGETTPKNILVVPIKIADRVLGVMEIASLQEFNATEIEFVERIAEVIASTFANVRNNARNRKLLEEYQQVAHQLREQEEETNQNLEELKAIQEDLEKSQLEAQLLLQQAHEREQELLNRIKELEEQLDIKSQQ